MSTRIILSVGVARTTYQTLTIVQLIIIRTLNLKGQRNTNNICLMGIAVSVP